MIEARTDKQKERAEEGLEKAMNALETSLQKVADAQIQYDIWAN